MRKKLLALALTLALVVSLCPATLAASTLKASDATTTVEKKLAELQTKDGYRPGDKGGQCMYFANKVFNQLFGCWPNNGEYYHGQINTSSNFIRIGGCVQPHAKCTVKAPSGDQTSITAETVKALLSQAKCGDIIQIARINTQKTYACEVGRPHTMVVQRVKSDSIVVYESNFSGPAETVGVREVTFKNFASWNDHVVTLYRAKNYDKVNGSSSTVTVDPALSTLTISPTTEPGFDLPQGKPFYFKGKITSNYPITSATISIFAPTDNDPVQSKTIYPNTTSVDIATSGLDALKFGQLEPGSYRFYLIAYDQSGCNRGWVKYFSIAGATPATPAPATPAPATPAPATPAPSTLKISLTTEPDSRHVYHTPFSLEGTITSNYNITYTYAAVKDRETGRAYLTRDDSPLVTTYNIKTSILNDLHLDEFATGNYTLEVIAKDASGKETRWQKDFSILQQSQSTKPQEPEDTGYTLTINYYIDDKLVFTDHSPDGNGDVCHIYKMPDSYHNYSFWSSSTNSSIGLFGTELWIPGLSENSTIDLYANSDGSTPDQFLSSYEVVIMSVDEAGTVLDKTSIFTLEGDKCYYRLRNYADYELARCDGDYSDCTFDSAVGLLKIPAVYQDGTVTLVYRKIQSASEPSPAPTSTPTPTPQPTSTSVPTSEPAISKDIEPSYYGGTAYASAQSVNVDGIDIKFEMYALMDANGGITNYIKLRDLALWLGHTPARFSVDWDQAVVIRKGASYAANGSEYNTPYEGDQHYERVTSSTRVDDRNVDLAAFCITDASGGGYTYYKLRDLGRVLDFNVSWSSSKGIYINTSEPYSPNS